MSTLKFLGVHGLGIINEIHFVYRDDEVRDSQKMSNRNVPTRLRHHPVPGVY